MLSLKRQSLDKEAFSLKGCAIYDKLEIWLPLSANLLALWVWEVV